MISVGGSREGKLLMTNEIYSLPTIGKHASHIHHAPKTHFNIHIILQNITCYFIRKFTMLDKHVTSLPYSKGNSCRHHMLYTIIISVLYEETNNYQPTS
jgi:hypothetical protein